VIREAPIANRRTLRHPHGARVAAICVNCLCNDLCRNRPDWRGAYIYRLARGLPQGERRATLSRALIIAFGVTLFFLAAGPSVLSHLGVTVHAFAISGGILLFVTALPVLFGQRPGLQAPEVHEHGAAGESIAVFSPRHTFASGPGTITTILLLTSQAGNDLQRLATLVLIIALVFIIAWLVLDISERLMARMGTGKVHIITRVLGIILAALAVQYVLDGLTGYYKSLTIG
jgi:multiple antibiotic resistance protein